jgi:hypothetical protein
MVLSSLLSLSLLAGVAHAEPHGLVIRLQVSGETISDAAFVVLTPKEGDATRVQVKDDGAAPDVAAGDGVWAGAVWLEGDAFEVSLDVDGKQIPGGPASWAATDSARDLAVGWKSGAVTVEAGVSGSGVGNAPLPGGMGDSPPAGAAPTPGGALPGGASMSPPPLGNAASLGASGDGTLYIGLGLGVLLLVGVAWLWLRSRPADEAARPSGLTVVAEPGLLGPGTPSLSDGLQLWLVSAEDAAAVVKPLLATLARHHRVLVVAPGEMSVPSVYGGPVFRSSNLRPSRVGDAAESLLATGGNVAVLLTGTGGDAASIKDYADLLPTGVGAVCVVQSDPGVPALARVTARWDGAVWVVTAPERTLRLVETVNGFEEAPVS